MSGIIYIFFTYLINNKFSGMEQIKQSTLDFLSELKLHNEREWFNRNRKLYEAAKSNYESLVQAIINAVSEFDPILKGLEANTCMFRINRDIRFSADKSIYKTHMGAFIVRGGKNNGDRFAGYYFHIEPGGNSMIAGGAYIPPTPWLSAIREKIGENGERFLKIVKDENLIKTFGSLEGEKLKTAPKGFPRDHPYIEFLKMKSFLVTKMIPDRLVTGPKCMELVVESCKCMKPLNDFLNDY
jgi:uncharacterized protein (TIGR02453 family)